MKWSDLPLKPTARVLRQFAAAWLVFFLAAIPAFLVMVLGIFSGNVALMVGFIGLAVIYLVILGLVQSALQSIYQAAVFLYARDGQVSAGFEAELLGNAMVRK